VQVFNMVLVVSFCFLLADPWGINGIAAAWLFAALATAVAVGPWLIAFIRNPKVRVGETSDELATEITAEIIDAETKSPAR
jgi:hypothetical protein